MDRYSSLEELPLRSPRSFSLQVCIPFNPDVANEYNDVRKAIKAYFPKRKCFTFPCPVRDNEQLQYLDQMLKKELSPKFLEYSGKFLEFVCARSDVMWAGETVTGNGECPGIYSVLITVSSCFDVVFYELFADGDSFILVSKELSKL